MVLCDFLIELFFKEGGVCLMFGDSLAFSQGVPKDEDSKNILLDYFVWDVRYRVLFGVG